MEGIIKYFFSQMLSLMLFDKDLLSPWRLLKAALRCDDVFDWSMDWWMIDGFIRSGSLLSDSPQMSLSLAIAKPDCSPNFAATKTADDDQQPISVTSDDGSLISTGRSSSTTTRIAIINNNHGWRIYCESAAQAIHASWDASARGSPAFIETFLWRCMFQ